MREGILQEVSEYRFYGLVVVVVPGEIDECIHEAPGTVESSQAPGK